MRSYKPAIQASLALLLLGCSCHLYACVPSAETAAASVIPAEPVRYVGACLINDSGGVVTITRSEAREHACPTAGRFVLLEMRGELLVRVLPPDL